MKALKFCKEDQALLQSKLQSTSSLKMDFSSGDRAVKERRRRESFSVKPDQLLLSEVAKMDLAPSHLRPFIPCRQCPACFETTHAKLHIITIISLSAAAAIIINKVPNRLGDQLAQRGSQLAEIIAANVKVV